MKGDKIGEKNFRKILNQVESCFKLSRKFGPKSDYFSHKGISHLHSLEDAFREMIKKNYETKRPSKKRPRVRKNKPRNKS